MINKQGPPIKLPSLWGMGVRAEGVPRMHPGKCRGRQKREELPDISFDVLIAESDGLRREGISTGDIVS